MTQDLTNGIDPQKLASTVSVIETGSPPTPFPTKDISKDREERRNEMMLQHSFYLQILSLTNDEFYKFIKERNDKRLGLSWWNFITRSSVTKEIQTAWELHHSVSSRIQSLISLLYSKISSTFPDYGDETPKEVENSQFGQEILNQIKENK